MFIRVLLDLGLVLVRDGVACGDGDKARDLGAKELFLLLIGRVGVAAAGVGEEIESNSGSARST